MEKTAGLAHFYFWKKEKFVLLVINQELTNLKQKYNNKMYPVRNYISYSLYYIDNYYYINKYNTLNPTETNNTI